MKVLRLDELIKITGLSKSTIYKEMSRGKFPEKIPLTRRSVGWLESEIYKWIETRSKEGKM